MRPGKKFKQDKDVKSHLEVDGLVDQLEPMREKYAAFCARPRVDAEAEIARIRCDLKRKPIECKKYNHDLDDT